MKSSQRPVADQPAKPAASDRKAEHIRLALEERMQLEANFFECYAFEHCALPEIDIAELDTSVKFVGRELSAPLLISCMTGGTDLAAEINNNLATAAQELGIAVGIGSQRKALEVPETGYTFRVRDVAPTAPLLANLGAVQLNYGFGADQCREAVEMIDADALVLHLNPLQEAIQPEGQGDFSNLLPKMAEVVRQLEVPVIVKEVGCGISSAVARRLVEVGIQIIDTAGLGGTSWARIEAQRADDRDIGEVFGDWGVPTPDAIQALRKIPGLEIIGSGGVRNGLDAGKAIALGAHVVGMAFPFLAAAMESSERVVEVIKKAVRELRICMFCVGTSSIADLRQVPIKRWP